MCHPRRLILLLLSLVSRNKSRVVGYQSSFHSIRSIKPRISRRTSRFLHDTRPNEIASSAFPLLATDPFIESDTSNDKQLSADSIFFDIEIQGTPVGRLIFHLTNPSPLPLHAENVIQLAKGSRRGIDPNAHYEGCEFDYSPATIEDGMGRYRWGHSLRGRGRNAIGRADQAIVDRENQLQATHSCFGGPYYRVEYTLPDEETDPGVFLTVPVLGPGHGSSKFSIVRVGESPKEWQERLLINSGVIGKLDPSCIEVLYTMARQRIGPPKVSKAGAMESGEELDID
ncbi:unnamed protein product [Cylindrotheca closterium]|uniref:PPIase cyclophilin-type domain-containing protein n=1 Tax=Cylindrotheca closterium TaxID=2856 RepID=A0AAD2FSA1_9STRA|nr:unnamed protein product [Cylindrotheca closterium]